MLLLDPLLGRQIIYSILEGTSDPRCFREIQSEFNAQIPEGYLPEFKSTHLFRNGNLRDWLESMKTFGHIVETEDGFKLTEFGKTQQGELQRKDLKNSRSGRIYEEYKRMVGGDQE